MYILCKMCGGYSHSWNCLMDKVNGNDNTPVFEHDLDQCFLFNHCVSILLSYQILQ